MVKMVLRMLADREMSGYDIYKELSMKGVNIRSNYLYMILTSMHNKSLLKGRWVQGTTGPRKHLYSLSGKGREEFRSMIKGSVEVVMDAFVHANLTAQDLPDHSSSVQAMFARLGIGRPGKGDRFVVAVPAFDPLLCYPIAFDVFAETFHGASVVVIKPPEVKLQADKPNLTFIDGQRYDMPFKEGFADYLMLEGFPQGAPEEDVVSECTRVLKNEGHLIVRHPVVMTEEKRPKFTTFGEFASRLFYDFSNQDKVVSVERLRRLLSRRFRQLGDSEFRGSVIFHGSGKRKVEPVAPLSQVSFPTVKGGRSVLRSTPRPN